jgi:hypothetical protein
LTVQVKPPASRRSLVLVAILLPPTLPVPLLLVQPVQQAVASDEAQNHRLSLRVRLFNELL